MLQLELPHVNVLSKVDLVEKYGKLDFNIDYYTEVQDLDYLLDRISDDPFTGKTFTVQIFEYNFLYLTVMILLYNSYTFSKIQKIE